MAKKRYSPEPIIQCLREVEIHTSEGKTIAQSVRHIWSDQTNLLSLEEGIWWIQHRPGEAF